MLLSRLCFAALPLKLQDLQTKWSSILIYVIVVNILVLNFYCSSNKNLNFLIFFLYFPWILCTSIFQNFPTVKVLIKPLKPKIMPCLATSLLYAHIDHQEPISNQIHSGTNLQIFYMPSTDTGIQLLGYI